MRTLVWITIGFACACVAGVYVLPGTWFLPLGIFCILGVLATLTLKSKHSRITRRILIGCLAGIIWMFAFDRLYLRTALTADDEVCSVQVELTDYSYLSGNGSAADGIVSLDGKTYKVKVYLKEQELFNPGDVVSGDFLFRYTADGGSRKPTYHQGNGVFLLGYAQNLCSVTKTEKLPVKYYPAYLARQISDRIKVHFPEDTYAFALALLLGDDRELDYETDKNLQVTGIRHVIAVSGLHVSILFSLIYSLCGKRRGLTAVIGIPLLVLFAAIAGFTPSIVRACVMQCLMILAMLINREYDPPTALSASVLVMLVVNPLTITSVSFQLSVSCMIGIFLFSEKIKAYLQSPKCFGSCAGKSIGRRIKRWCITSVSITISAMVFTTPLCAYYFGSVSVVGVITNLLTLWVVSFVFYGIMLSCVLGLIYLPLGKGIAWILSWAIRYVLMISDLLSKIPFASVYTSSVYVVAWLVFCYVLFMVFLRHKKKQPALFMGCMAVGLIAAILLTFFEKPKEDFSVVVMDVGQGQCVLLQSNEDTYLVDCGNSYGDAAADIALRELWTRGIFSLDGIIVTHYDKDHAGGVNALVSWMKVDTLYLPDTTQGNDLREEIVSKNEKRISWVREMSFLELENGKITIFPSAETEDPNESSLCILFQVENYDILITGDRAFAGEEELLQTGMIPKLELLVVGHHGSAESTSLELLRQTQPVTAVISVGAENTYGHPSVETLERLRLFGCNVLRTDLEGTITFGR